MSNFKLNARKILQILLILSILISVINCQSTGEYDDKSMEASKVFGIGWGVFAVILAMIVGVIICIFGMATVFPGVFIAIGICLPTCIFLFFAFCPAKSSSGASGDNTENTAKNVYIVWRWLYFSVMLALVLALIAPMCMLWNIMIVPQRVDSRAQKAYDERYKEMLEEEIKKEKNIDEPSLPGVEELPGMNEGNNNNQFNTYSDPLAMNRPENENRRKFGALKRKKKNEE